MHNLPKKWDGMTERRKVQDHNSPIIICKQEDRVTNMYESMIRTEGTIDRLDARINGTLEKMALHVEDSDYWRRFIVGTAVGLVISILGGIVTISSIAYNLGEYTKQIRVNTDRLEHIEGIDAELAKTMFDLHKLSKTQ